jgi:hypothetical protein
LDFTCFPLDSIFKYANSLTTLNGSVHIGVGDRWLEGINKNSIFIYFNNDGEELGNTQIPNEALGNYVIANVICKLVRKNDSLFMNLSVWINTPDGKLGQIFFDTSGSIYIFHQYDNCIAAEDLIKTFDNNYAGIAYVEESNNYSASYCSK